MTFWKVKECLLPPQAKKEKNKTNRNSKNKRRGKKPFVSGDSKKTYKGSEVRASAQKKWRSRKILDLPKFSWQN